MSYIEEVKISDKSLMEIKSSVGGTLLSEELMDFMPDDDILKYVVAPTMEKFFNYFPIIVEFQQYNTASSSLPIEVEAPERTLGILRQQFVSLSSSIPSGDASVNSFGIYDNPFASANALMSSNGAYPGGSSRYGTPYDYGSSQNIYQARLFQKSLESSNKSYFVRYDELKNKLYLKSDTSGRFYIQFATWNNDFENSIPLRLRQSVMSYAQGLLRVKFAQILSLSRSELPSEIDTAELKDEGKDMMEKELTYWNEASTIATMR